MATFSAADRRDLAKRGLAVCPRCKERPKRATSSYCSPCASAYRQERLVEPIIGVSMTCKDCGLTDVAENFPVDRTRPTGRQWLCFVCYRLRRLSAQLKHETSGAHDRETYEAAFERQMGLCAICGNEQTEGKRLCADHDHATGKPRGLLCDRCNWAIGLLGEDPERFNAAREYIEAWRG